MCVAYPASQALVKDVFTPAFQYSFLYKTVHSAWEREHPHVVLPPNPGNRWISPFQLGGFLLPSLRDLRLCTNSTLSLPVVSGERLNISMLESGLSLCPAVQLWLAGRTSPLVPPPPVFAALRGFFAKVESRDSGAWTRWSSISNFDCCSSSTSESEPRKGESFLAEKAWGNCCSGPRHSWRIVSISLPSMASLWNHLRVCSAVNPSSRGSEEWSRKASSVSKGGFQNTAGAVWGAETL